MTVAGSPTCLYFEKSFQADRVRQRYLQINARQCGPFFRRPRRWFEQMRNGKPCPQGGAVAAIECKQFVRRPVTQSRRNPPADVAPRPPAAEPLALEIEKGDFVERVGGTQGGVELQAVDDARRVAETNMLRPQIAMAIDDAPCPHAVRQQRSAQRQEAALGAVDAADQTGGHGKAWIEQNALIDLQTAFPGDEMHPRRNVDRRCAAIELHQSSHQPIDLPSPQTVLHNGPIEHGKVFEAAHHHEPIDRLSGPADGQPCRRQRQWNGAKIDLWCEPPVERYLRPASRRAARQRGKIKVRKAHRLFELICPIVGEKHPRHVGFPASYLTAIFRIGPGLAQECDLRVKFTLELNGHTAELRTRLRKRRMTGLARKRRTF